jgi:hypothetical protein
MSCNCQKKETAAPSKFGTCQSCISLTVAGFVYAWLFFGFAALSGKQVKALFVFGVPAFFFSIWLLLHAIGYMRRRLKRNT